MGFLSILVTGIGLSMDAFAVSLAKGMTTKGNQVKNAIKIALYFGGFQALMPLVGWWLGRYFESYIKSFDHWIAFILLIAIGGKMIYESIKGDDESEDGAIAEIGATGSTNNDHELSHKNLFILAVATSIDALAVGVSFAFLNVSIIPSIIIIGITTFVLSMIAVLIGKKLGSILQNYAELIGGVILILIGIKILIEHLFM